MGVSYFLCGEISPATGTVWRENVALAGRKVRQRRVMGLKRGGGGTTRWEMPGVGTGHDVAKAGHDRKARNLFCSRRLFLPA